MTPCTDRGRCGLRHRWTAGWLAALLMTSGVWGQTRTACPPVATPPTAAQMQTAQASAQDRGFLWRIKRDGQTSFLYGTVHLGKLAWAFPGPTVRAAMGLSDTLAVELDLSDPAIVQAIRASRAGQADGLTLPPALRQRLNRQIAAACLPAQALAGQHPVMGALTLAVLAARWEGLDAGYAQELVLGTAARAVDLRVVSLETAQQQIGALIPEDEQQARLLVEQTLAQIESGVTRKTSARLAQAWAEGRLEDLERYEQWCQCVNSEADRALLRRLNDDRNPTLARRIEALHASGKRVFVAVGALHMTGPRALTTLLAERGFIVERVDFKP